VLYVHDNSGRPMAATFEAGLSDNAISLLFNSAGGKPKKPGGVSRNADYPAGLELILRRLGQLGAILEDAYVDSRETHKKRLTLDERRLELPGWSYPVQLNKVDDFDLFRRKFTAAQRLIGKEDKTKGGNERKRVRMQLQVPGFQPIPEAVERLGLILSESQVLTEPETASEAPERGTTVISSKGKLQGNSSSGQGFITDVETKLAVEAAAMTAAQSHYESQGWTVTDVSMKKVGYDLLCERDGKCWHVEVKGTTQSPKSVLVSPNEVSFALANPETAVLFVLSNIVINKQDGVASATGGMPLPIEPWDVQMERLSATGYNYALDGLG